MPMNVRAPAELSGRAPASRSTLLQQNEQTARLVTASSHNTRSVDSSAFSYVALECNSYVKLHASFHADTGPIPRPPVCGTSSICQAYMLATARLIACAFVHRPSTQDLATSRQRHRPSEADLRLSPLWPRVVADHEARFQSRLFDVRSQVAKFVRRALVLQCESVSRAHLLQGASDAFVKTLYSRARRIGLEGSACVLRGLRKQTPFDLVMVTVARTVIEPGFELIISPKQ